MKRQLWVSSVFIAVAAGFSGWLVGTTLIDQQIKELKRKASVALTVEATESEGYLENTTRLLQVLATSEEIKQALLSLDTAIEQLEPTFKRVIKAYPTLHQIRWIDETGKEQIRHQRDGTLVYQIPEFELQNKSDRYYFQEAIARSYGNIYFSPIDLNVEHGAIETPYRPMIRIAARVADSEGRARGILIANDSMRGWFEDLPGRRSEKHYWVVNHEGDWLRSDIAEQEWGFVLGKRHQLQDSYPEVWRSMSARHQGEGHDSHGNIWLWESVDLVNHRSDSHLSFHGKSPKVFLLDKLNYEDLAAVARNQWLEAMGLAFGYGFVLWLFWALHLYWQDKRDQMRLALERSELEVAQNRLLSKAQKRIANLVENHVNGFLVVDHQGRILQVNSALEDMFGYTPGELIGRPISVLQPESIAALHEEHFERFLRKPRQSRMVEDRRVAGRRKDGSEIVLEVVLNPLVEDGQMEIGATVIDITERIQREQDIQIYAQAFMTAGEAIAILDESGLVSHVNRAFTELTGFSEVEALGMTADRFLVNDHSSGGLSLERLRNDESEDWSGRHQALRKDGASFPVKVEVSVDHSIAMDGRHGRTVVSFLDISELEETSEKLRKLALYDQLTGLPNRTLLYQMVENSIARTNRRRNKFALMFIDLDNFKLVNDGLGHQAGDQLLIKVAEILKSALRTEDTVARLGGDEFVVLMEGLDSTEALMNISLKLMKRLNVPFAIKGESIRVTASMGICVYPDDGMDFPSLLRKADAAMYQAKEAGKAGFQFFQEEYATRSTEMLRLDFQLNNAIANNQLFLMYQPQYELASGRLCGVEALVRWRHPERGVVMPDEFIPLAEKVALLDALERWVFEHACLQAAVWRNMNLDVGRVAINLTGYRLNKGSFNEDLQELLRRTGCSPDAIEIEITEEYIVQRAESALKDLDHLREMGVRIAVDDFGTGYSSLSYLKELPVDKLKIDRSFICDLEKSSGGQKIITALLAMARELDLAVVAEGVETEQQKQFLQERGCHSVQGYFFSQPITADELTAMVSAQNVVQMKKEQRP